MGPSVADLPTLSRLYDAVAELPAHAREAWFAALPETERRFEAPLRDMLARQQASGEGTGPALPQLGETQDLATPQAGDRIGPYRLLHQLGQGGMGMVWLAERVEGGLQRRVALKLPRLAWGAGLAERMARERDIGALLEHPNIARLYDAGVDALGRPFLALEVIEGQSIDAYCRERGLDVAARLRLFLQVMRAVAYAHGRLVVHRDLKPSNVLVSADGTAHLLDFGIAKLLDDSVPRATLTQQGRVMTPPYASPEQIEGSVVTVQSDVYSLGVLLYELLTGQLPFKRAPGSPAAAEAAILRGDAPPASSQAKDKATARALKGEVDAILAKAMRRLPGGRYATADALAQDIERHLAGETVSARPDSAGYRLRKALRRHWLPVVAVTAVVTTALAGGGAALMQSRRAVQQAERAHIVTQFVAEMFRTGVQSSLGAASAARTSDAVESAAGLIESRFAQQPELQAELYGAVAKIYTELGAGRPAVAYAERQLKALEQAGAPEQARVEALVLQVEALERSERYPEAEQRARQALQMLAPGSRQAFDLGAGLLTALRDQGKKAEARQLEQQLAASPWAGPERPSLGGAILAYYRAEESFQRGDVDVSLGLFEQAFELAQAIQGKTSNWVARNRLQVAIQLAAIGRGPQALLRVEEALAPLHDSGPIGRLRAATLEARFWEIAGCGCLLPYQDQIKALESVRATLSEFSSALPPEVPAKIDFALGMAALNHGEVETAYKRLTAAVPTLAATAQRSKDRIFYGAHLGMAAMAAGHHAEADPLYRSWLRLRHELGDENKSFAAYDWAEIAHNLLMQGQAADAERELLRAPRFGAYKPEGGTGSRYEEIIPRERARVRLELGDVEGALQLLPSADTVSAENDTVFAHYALRGEVWCAGSRPEEGLAWLQHWVSAVAPGKSKQDPGLARVRAVAGLCALKAGDRSTARNFAEQARQAFAQQPGVSPWFKQPLQRLDAALGRVTPART